MKSLLLALLLLPIFVRSQTRELPTNEKQRQFAEIEKTFFASCLQKFSFIRSVKTAPYKPSDFGSFPPTTTELYIDFKEDFGSMELFKKYLQSINIEIGQITDRYFRLHGAHFEVQHQIILYLSTKSKSISYPVL